MAVLGVTADEFNKLLYILLYLKLYPTYDALAVLTNHYRSKCGDSVQLLLPILEMVLKRRLVLPKRHGNNLEEIFRQHPEIKDIFIDGTERKVQKPKNLKKRNKLYSGKKKTTTRKSIIISEHAIGGFKRFKATSDTYRNKLNNFDDLLTKVSIGLWNFNLQQTTQLD